MARLLIVHHTPSPAMQQMLEVALAATDEPDLKDLNVKTRAALAAGPADVLECDAILLGTPANIGYMSGALKHFFDQIYYPCLNDTKGLPYGLYVHGNNSTIGAVRSVDTIAKGLRWRQVDKPTTVEGPLESDSVSELGNLTQVLAAHALGLLK